MAAFMTTTCRHLVNFGCKLKCLICKVILVFLINLSLNADRYTIKALPLLNTQFLLIWFVGWQKYIWIIFVFGIQVGLCYVTEPLILYFLYCGETYSTVNSF